MNVFDLLIIYLTCGAPLGVFYFLQNRRKQNIFHLSVKTFFTFIFWMPYGIKLALKTKIGKFISFNKLLASKSGATHSEIFLYQKRFEDVLQKHHLQISIFEFREVFDRYVGLSIAREINNKNKAAPGQEFFNIANYDNAEIGAICLKRRNLKRLAFHQIQARQDFLQLICRLTADEANANHILKLAIDFSRLLNDTKALSQITDVSFGNLPEETKFAAEHSESILWNTELIKSPPVKLPAIHLAALTAQKNSSVKD